MTHFALAGTHDMTMQLVRSGGLL